MSFGKTWLEKTISSILIVIISAYLIGSIIFFIDTNSNYKQIQYNTTEINKQNQKILKQDSIYSLKNQTTNSRVDKYININTEQHKKLELKVEKMNKNIENLIYVVNNNNEKMKKEFQNLQQSQNYTFITKK